MKEAIGGTWIFGIFLVFVAAFTCFVSVTTNYSRCFKIKDEIVTTIEHYKGVNEKSLNKIQQYLNSIGYTATGDCPDDGSNWCGFPVKGSYGFSSPNNFCITKHSVVSKNPGADYANGPIGHVETAYYGVVVFFRLDWPVFRQVFRVTISGETSLIYLPKDTERRFKAGSCG